MELKIKILVHCLVLAGLARVGQHVCVPHYLVNDAMGTRPLMPPDWVRG